MQQQTNQLSMEEQLKQKDGTIQALCGIISQLVPVVQCLMPLIKDRKEIDQQMVLQIEKIVQIATMLLSMNMVKDAKELNLGDERDANKANVDGTSN